MTTRTYNLRSKKIDTTYFEHGSKVLKGMTSRYNTYEKIGEITRLIDKANIRYGNKSIRQNFEEFLILYKDYISNYEILIWRLNDIHEPILIDSLDHICSVIQETLTSKIREFNLMNKFNDENNICEHYLMLNKLMYVLKDYVLLLIKYKEEKGDKCFLNVIKYYDTINDFVNKLYNKYKNFKRSEYDRQKVSLLYNTLLPKDVCKYVIKEFL